MGGQTGGSQSQPPAQTSSSQDQPPAQTGAAGGSSSETRSATPPRTASPLPLLGLTGLLALGAGIGLRLAQRH